MVDALRVTVYASRVHLSDVLNRLQARIGLVALEASAPLVVVANPPQHATIARLRSLSTTTTPDGIGPSMINDPLLSTRMDDPQRTPFNFSLRLAEGVAKRGGDPEVACRRLVSEWLVREDRSPFHFFSSF